MIELECTDGKKRHYCRGCGGPLVLGFRGFFHPDCLKADKRRRTLEKRQRDQERIWTWLRSHGCTECQTKFRSQARISQEPSEDPLCEASRRHSEPRKIARIGEGSPEQLAPKSGENSPLEEGSAG
jgi:hypothetical protein